MVQGIKQLEDKLKREIPKAVSKGVQEAMEKSADEIVSMMKNLVPVKTGALRDTIGWTWGNAPDGSVAVGGGSAGNNLRITIYAGSTATLVGARAQFQLARIMEFGTASMKAHPFFYPSWRSKRGAVRGRISRAIKKGLQS